MCLLARYLESNGILTVVIGSAMDIVEHCGAPRYLHNDFPLGNPCGKPYDRTMQRAIILQALRFFDRASMAKPIERTPYAWDDNERYISGQSGSIRAQVDELSWRDLYSRVDQSNSQLLAERGEARRKLQERAKVQGGERNKMIPDEGA